MTCKLYILIVNILKFSGMKSSKNKLISVDLTRGLKIQLLVCTADVIVRLTLCTYPLSQS